MDCRRWRRGKGAGHTDRLNRPHLPRVLDRGDPRPRTREERHMAARHQSRTPQHRLRPFLLPLLVGSLAVTGLVVANAAASSHCHGAEVPLRIAVPPAFLAPVQAIADAFNHDSPDTGGQCATVDVSAEPAAQVVQDLPVNPVDPPALWIPDSALWVPTAQQLEGRVTGPTPRLAEHPSIA